MEHTHYLALLRKDVDSDYGVDFPDLPGCISAGRTLNEAIENAHEALALHLDGMVEDGETVPAPRDADTIMAHPESAGAIAFLVAAATRRPRTVRFQATMKEDLLARIDAAASNRSRFLADAAEAELRRQARRK